LLESSPALRAKLQDTLREHIGTGKAAVPEEQAPLVSGCAPVQAHVGAGALTCPAEHSSGSADIRRVLAPAAPLIVFANEFFDALPVEILGTHGKLHIALENNRLCETWLPPLAEELEFLDRYGVHP